MINHERIFQFLKKNLKVCFVRKFKTNSVPLGESKPCRFPFIYNNETFLGCTTVSNNEIGQTDISWCSTKTDQLDEHDEFGSYFGECLSEICPSAEQGLKAQEEEINLQIGM